MHTNNGTTPAPGVPDKTFATVSARFVLKGHALHRSTRDEGGANGR